jgi:tetratricopeptide (TPR) repeat protein
VQSAKGRKLSSEELKDRLEGVDTVVLNGGFEEIKSTLTACAKLFEQFYEQTELRDAIQNKITSSWAKLPLQVRVEILMSMSESALKVKGNAKALELVTLAQQQFTIGQWLPESEVAFIGELAKLRARAGDIERARRELEAGLKKYDEAEAKIVDIYRATALRPVAEAWFVIGDRTKAAALYARALEAGMQNPNSRPRADDLSATACSMAVIGFQPDAAQFDRMRKILAGLGDPW